MVKISKLTTTVLLTLLFLSSISFAQVVTFHSDSKGSKTHVYKNNNGVTNTELEYRGKIIFTDDETDVKYISPGGFLKFSKRSFGTKRTIILEGESNNKITREYKEGSKKLPFEPDGKKWMASVLPEIIRTTGIGAEERAKKFYAKGGINALLEEIALLSTNYVQRKYYDASFKMQNLKASDMVLLIESAGEEVNSSYELSKILTNNSSNYSGNEKAVTSAIKIAADISSSYEQANVFEHLLKESELSDANKGLIITNVRNISSSYEQSNVLQASLENTLTKENLELIITEVDHISSSYEQSKVLQALIKSQSIEGVGIEVVVQTVSKISSSYEQGKVLGKLVENQKLNSSQIVELAQAAKYISSGYEISKFLQSIAKEQTLDEASINGIIVMTSELSSSYEQSKVLQAIISSNKFTNSNYNSVIGQVPTINSSYEQSQVLTKLIELNKIPNAYMLALIKAIDGVSSSYEKSKLLQKLGGQLPADKETRSAFFKAAESLSNDDYGKIMRTVNK